MPDSFFDIWPAVDTDEELTLYAVGVAQADEEIEDIEIKDDSVMVESEETVRLFGFIPVEADRTVTVGTNEDGEVTDVEVDYPWWGFLAAKAGADLEVELMASGDADDRPTEEVAFYYNKIQARILSTIASFGK